MMFSNLLTCILIDACPRSPLLLHGRQVPRLLHNHHRLLARPNGSHLRWLLDGFMSTYWRQGAVDRGMQFPEEVEVSMRMRKMLLRGEEVEIAG